MVNNNKDAIDLDIIQDRGDDIRKIIDDGEF
jgi:hypothetical protein